MNGDETTLVSALAEGYLGFYKIRDDLGGLDKIKVEILHDSIPLEMTLAVATRQDDNIFSCSNLGNINNWQIRSGQVVIANSFKAHDAEIWYVSFDCNNRNLLYSASDDTFLKIWDVREPQRPVHTVREHEAGVCWAEGSPWEEFQFASGSYDETLKVWDKRVNRGEALASIECGSGVWRGVWSPDSKEKLGFAGMRAGFGVCNIASESVVHVVNPNGTGDHVAYGIDWSERKSKNQQNMLASCSFYNHEAQIFYHK